MQFQMIYIIISDYKNDEDDDRLKWLGWVGWSANFVETNRTVQKC